jgi:hypothetical protein
MAREEVRRPNVSRAGRYAGQSRSKSAGNAIKGKKKKDEKKVKFLAKRT